MPCPHPLMPLTHPHSWNATVLYSIIIYFALEGCPSGHLNYKRLSVDHRITTPGTISSLLVFFFFQNVMSEEVAV